MSFRSNIFGQSKENLTPQLYAYYGFQETSGSIIHDSINGLDGTTNGSWDTKSFRGGRAIWFSNRRAIVPFTLGNMFASPTNQFSCLCWVNTDAGGQPAAGVFLSYGTGVNTNANFTIFHRNNSQLCVIIRGSETVIDVSFSYNTWRGIFVSWDSVTARALVLGSGLNVISEIILNVGSAPEETNVGTGITLAMASNLTQYSKGVIDEVYFWDAGLSFEAMQQFITDTF